MIVAFDTGPVLLAVDFLVAAPDPFVLHQPEVMLGVLVVVLGFDHITAKAAARANITYFS